MDEEKPAQNPQAPPVIKPPSAEEKKARERIMKEAGAIDYGVPAAPRRKKKRRKGTAKKKPKISPFVKHKKLLIWLGALAFVGYVAYLFMQPRMGSMAYGICRVFLERSVEFPDTLRISEVTELGSSVRIWYVQTDSYGQYRMEPIQCYYKPDPQWGYILEKISIRRRDIPQAEVDAFNKVLPVVRASNPDLTIPPPLPDSLENLQIDIYGLMGL